jgi:hypothetical protein
MEQLIRKAAFVLDLVAHCPSCLLAHSRVIEMRNQEFAHDN